MAKIFVKPVKKQNGPNRVTDIITTMTETTLRGEMSLPCWGRMREAVQPDRYKAE